MTLIVLANEVINFMSSIS